MTESYAHPGAAARPGLASVVVGFAGVAYCAIGLALLLAPEWFFRTIGPFPPFNRHYEGDLGAFLLPLGAALLVAARAPAQHRALVLFAGVASLIHAGNHIYDAVIDGAGLGRWLTDVLPLVVFAVAILLVGAGPRADRTGAPRPAQPGAPGAA